MNVFLNSSGEPVDDNLPEHISFNFAFDNPLDSHTREELHQMGKDQGEEAQKQFEESIAKLSSIIRACSPVTLLSHFAYFDTSFHDVYKRESEYQPVDQHNVELLQALILTVPSSDLSKDWPTQEHRMETNRLLKDAGSGFALQRLGGDGGLETIIREQARSHTQAVRNPGTEGQVLRNLKDLFAPLDPLLFKRKGVTFSGLIALCEGFKAKIISRLNTHRHSLQNSFQQRSRERMIEVFGEQFGLPAFEISFLKKEDAKQSTEAKQTQSALFNYSEKVFPRIFSAHLDELLAIYPGVVDRESLKKSLSLWSSEFGSLEGSNIEYLFLDNPIWQRPFIQISDDGYFWPVFTNFISFGIGMLEAQMEDDTKLKEAYHERRTQFTEDKAAELLATIGPSARPLRNLRWSDAGKKWENDLLVLYDSHALVVECKSGKLKDTARRGGQSLNQGLKKLVEEATEQGYRFEQFLKAQQGIIQLLDEHDVMHEIDTSKIRRYTRLNILLDYLGPLATQDKLLRRSLMITTSAPSAVTMALVDLENFLYLIESPGLRLHYLHRRAPLERKFEIIGDELDLIAFYLGGGRWPSNEDTKMALFNCSQTLDRFLRRRDLGLSKKIPKLRLNSWWKDVLDRMETKAIPGWTEAAIVLLSFPFENQEDYFAIIESTIAETTISPQLTEGREIICAAFPSPAEMVGIATHVTVEGTVLQNRDKLAQTMNHLFNMAPEPECGLAFIISPDCYPYTNFGMGV